MTKLDDELLFEVHGGVVCTVFGITEVRLPAWLADALGIRDCF